jgi:hypothetical protein
MGAHVDRDGRRVVFYTPSCHINVQTNASVWTEMHTLGGEDLVLGAPPRRQSIVTVTFWGAPQFATQLLVSGSFNPVPTPNGWLCPDRQGLTTQSLGNANGGGVANGDITLPDSPFLALQGVSQTGSPVLGDTCYPLILLP